MFFLPVWHPLQMSSILYDSELPRLIFPRRRAQLRERIRPPVIDMTSLVRFRIPRFGNVLTITWVTWKEVQRLDENSIVKLKLTASRRMYCAKLPDRYNERRMIKHAEYIDPDSMIITMAGRTLSPDLMMPRDLRCTSQIRKAINTVRPFD